MQLLWTFWLVLAVTVHFDLVCTSNSSCPTWFHYSNTTQQCECGTHLGQKLHCHQQEMKVEISDGFCVTFSGEEGLYYAGHCPLRHRQNRTNRMYSELPDNPDQLNDLMCDPYNRKGLLCGQCIDGYGPTAYIVDKKCANCSKHSTGYAVSLYLLLELFTVILFFLCVAIFQINVTAGPLLGYLLFCQLYVIWVQRHIYIYDNVFSPEDTSALVSTLFHCSLTLSELWTLNFLWSVIPPFCISPNITGIHIQMLSLVAVVYVIVLVISTSFLVELYKRNYRIVRILWKPIGIVFKKIKATNVTSNVSFHMLAVFVLLSASNLTVHVSSIFEMVPVYRSTDGSVYKRVLYSDPNGNHNRIYILFVILAIVSFVLLVLVPSLLLCVYPTRLYRYLAQCLSARKRLAITSFVEALHNCFKDGSNGTRDYRVLAGLITLASIMGLIPDYFLQHGYNPEFIFGVMCVFLSFIVSYAQPCRLTLANFSLSYHSSMLGIFSIADGLWKHDMNTGTHSLKLAFVVIPVVSHILVYTWAGYTIICRMMLHFGYQMDIRSAWKKAWTALVRVTKLCYHRRWDSYQELTGTVQ